MAKAVVYALVLTAFIAFVIFSPINRKGHTKPSLNRRLGFNSPNPNFDPLVTKMERLGGKERSSHEHVSSETSHENKADGENEYFDSHGKLNVTLRLMVLFPIVDNSPKDGLISFKELETWNVLQAKDRLNYQTQRKLAIVDMDSDGEVTLREYLPHFNDDYFERNGTGHGEASWYQEQFANCDRDRNGKLNFNEFMDFLYPEDSNDTVIQKWLLKEKMRRMDYNDNGKLEFNEFEDHVYDTYKAYFEYETTSAVAVPKPKDKFAELDVNKNNVLEIEELLPLFAYLNPGELSHAKYYTSYLFYEADDNRDGYLTLGEMLNHEFVFYDTIFEDEEDDDYHDEL